MPKTRIHHTKVVAFNLTRDQYQRLQAEFVAGGAHSLADLARAKVMRGVNGNSLAEVARKLDQLEQAIHQLSHALQCIRGQDTGASHGR
jgi:hypothetical protein